MLKRLIGPAAGVLAVVSTLLPGAAGQLELRPVADTTLFESAPRNNMGAHSHVAIGVTALGSTARGLFRFDLSSLPTNTVVESVSLTFHLQVINRPDNVGTLHAVHRVTREWFEGSKSGNQGAPATAGEATWNHNALPTLWTAAGGDFVSTASAVEIMGPSPGFFTVNSTTGLVEVVQSWVRNPGENFGWLVKVVNESETLTARRFSSREGTNAVTMRIEYQPPETADLEITAIRREGANVVIQWIGGEGA